MKDKINMKVCIGTACYVMGASDLIVLEDYIAEDMIDKIDLECLTCLNYCKDENKGKPPFALIEDELVSSATVDKVMNKINEHLKQ